MHDTILDVELEMQPVAENRPEENPKTPLLHVTVDENVGTNTLNLESKGQLMFNLIPFTNVNCLYQKS